MENVEKYREYAIECRRLAGKLPPKDRDAMLKIAEAWDRQAEMAARRKQS